MASNGKDTIGLANRFYDAILPKLEQELERRKKKSGKGTSLSFDVIQKTIKNVRYEAKRDDKNSGRDLVRDFQRSVRNVDRITDQPDILKFSELSSDVSQKYSAAEDKLGYVLSLLDQNQSVALPWYEALGVLLAKKVQSSYKTLSAGFFDGIATKLKGYINNLAMSRMLSSYFQTRCLALNGMDLENSSEGVFWLKRFEINLIYLSAKSQTYDKHSPFELLQKGFAPATMPKSCLKTIWLSEYRKLFKIRFSKYPEGPLTEKNSKSLWQQRKRLEKDISLFFDYLSIAASGPGTRFFSRLKELRSDQLDAELKATLLVLAGIYFKSIAPKAKSRKGYWFRRLDLDYYQDLDCFRFGIWDRRKLRFLNAVFSNLNYDINAYTFDRY